MPNRSREVRKQQDQQASWDRLRLEPWRPDGSRRAFGSGKPRVQSLSLPTFSPSKFWEMCERESEWLLYSATVMASDWPHITVRGYEPVEFESARLKSYFERLASISTPIAPYLNGMAGKDGTITQLALFGDLSSRVRFQWWLNHPPHWNPIVEIADEMLASFASMGASK